MASLSPLHKHLVRRTFIQLATYDEEAMRLFCQRLMELNPALLPTLSSDPGGSLDRSVERLALVISLLDDPAALRVQLHAIRVRERNFAKGHYQQAGEALLWVIEQRLGDTFTCEIQTAWSQFYQYLADLTGVPPDD